MAHFYTAFDKLNQLGSRTPRGKKWYASSVTNLIAAINGEREVVSSIA